MNNQAVDFIQQYKRKVEQELRNFFKEIQESESSLDKTAKEALDLLEEYTLRGGKRIRAALVFQGFACIKKPKDEGLIFAACAMELIQSFLLIHDDIMDNDDVRRGGPTIHASYRTQYPQRAKSLAICVGDIAITLAYELILKTSLPGEQVKKAMQHLNRMTRKVIYGQILDVISESSTEEEILKLYHYKTSTYTIEGPLIIGALLAGATEEELSALSEFAVPAGIAFQIQDDLLGLFGNEEKIGKPVGSDIDEGKQTLLVILARKKASEKEKLQLEESLGSKCTDKARSECIAIIKKHAKEDAEHTAKKYANAAQKELKSANLKHEGKEFLADCAKYLFERTL